jgi:hypothetical protein
VNTNVGAIAALCLLIVACSSTVDLSRGIGKTTDYVPGAVYELLQDRYLENQGWPAGFGRPVVVASSVTDLPQGEPSSIADYRANPAKWPNFVGVLPAGTQLRLQGIERYRYPGLEDTFPVHAVIASGEFRGREVELSWISAGVPGTRMHRIDPQELRLVSADASKKPAP